MCIRDSEKAFTETVHILRTADKGQVRCLSIGILVLFAAIITVAVRMLCRGDVYKRQVYVPDRDNERGLIGVYVAVKYP